MNETNTEIIRLFAESCGSYLTDEEAAEVERNAPLGSHLIVTQPESLDAWLRGLDSERLSLLIYLAREYWGLLDLDDPAGWDDEWRYVVAYWYLTETDDDSPSDEQLANAAVNLAHLAVMESQRRGGIYEWVAEYYITSARLPLAIKAKLRQTAH